MIMREIGSEFWIETYLKSEKCRHLLFNQRSRGFLCGRTALDYIIRDAKMTIGFESVLLPSYCCQTMIEPFIRNEIKVRFYPVVVDRERGILRRLPEPKAEEALYLMPYFGFEKIESYGQQAKQWKFCILDETHSCFSGPPITYSDWNVKYTYASYRKWSDIRGLSIANKMDEDFFLPYVKKYHEKYLAIKSQACALKQKYMEDRKGDKEVFLKLYAEAEEMLDADYADYAFLREGISTYEKLDFGKVQNKRRENGGYLLEKLKKIRGIRLIYSCLADNCPLFIPILVENNLRDALRGHLIKHEIYCPVHWALSEYHVLESLEEKELYEKELSVICDQRYGISDMQRMIQCISDFFEK